MFAAVTRWTTAIALLLLSSSPAAAQVVGVNPATIAPPIVVWPAGYIGTNGVAAGSITIPDPGALILGPGGSTSLSAAGVLTLAGNVQIIGASSLFNATANGIYSFGSRARIISPADGQISVTNAAGSIGSTFKADALPTVGSGFGAAPAVTAGSTPLAGSVNVGTGGAATSGVITFGGTAFPAAPFCTYSTQTTNATTRGVPTTTQLTLNSTTAWLANDVVSWICISSK
jgi:hypothetical protein